MDRTALALVWTQVVLFINDGRKPGEKLPHACKHNAAFWLQCIITFSIILPWVRLRKVNVRAVTLSQHATRLYFNYSGSFPLIERPITLVHYYLARPSGSLTLPSRNSTLSRPSLSPRRTSPPSLFLAQVTGQLILFRTHLPSSGSVVFPKMVSSGLPPCSVAWCSSPLVPVSDRVPTLSSKVVSQFARSGPHPTSVRLSVTNSSIRFSAILPTRFSMVRNRTHTPRFAPPPTHLL